jgi:protein-disulfide isomerase
MSVEDLTVPVSERDHADGPADAPATLVVYGDYECPYTRAAHVAIRRVQPRLGGAMRYVYRHFPLRAIHPHAQHAAEAAEAAHGAGQFWAMHDRLFRDQDALTDADLARHGAALGLGDAVADALRTHARAERVEEDVRGGLASGVGGTPTLFINGVGYDGERDPEALEAALRRAMPSADDRPR